MDWSEWIGEQVSELENCCGSVFVRCCWKKLVAEARGQFGKPEEGECPTLEAAAKQRLVKA
jgi:hypothetical protein